MTTPEISQIRPFLTRDVPSNLKLGLHFPLGSVDARSYALVKSLLPFSSSWNDRLFPSDSFVIEADEPRVENWENPWFQFKLCTIPISLCFGGVTRAVIGRREEITCIWISLGSVASFSSDGNEPIESIKEVVVKSESEGTNKQSR